MTSCDKMLELLSRSLDGDLTGDEQAALDAHLTQCDGCRSLARELERCHAQLSALGESAPPEGFAARVMERVEQEGQGAAVVPFFRRPVARGLAALAACAVLCVGLYYAGALRPAGQSVLSAAAPRMAAPAEDDLATDFEEAYDGDSLKSSVSVEEDGGTAAQSAENGIAAFSLPSEVLEPAPEPAPETVPPEPEPAQGAAQTPQNEQRLRVCYGFTPAAPSAQILGSVASLTDFLALFPEDDLSALTAAYGADFFRSKRLLAVVLEEGSGSVVHSLGVLTADEVTVLRRVPELGTTDMAAWLLLAELDADAGFADGDTLTVRLETQP